MLAYAGGCRFKTIEERLTHADVCWRMLAYAGGCRFKTIEERLECLRYFADVCLMLTYAGVFWRMLAYWNVSDTEKRKVLEVRTKKLLLLEERSTSFQVLESSC